MSEYHVVDLELQDRNCIIKALEEMGYKPLVNDVAQNLSGYQGDKRKQKAHIIIPRSQVGNASNDVGFEHVNGKYIMHLSEYDQSVQHFKVNLFKQLYGKNKLYKFLNSNVGKFIHKKTQVDKDGTIRVRIQSTTLS